MTTLIFIDNSINNVSKEVWILDSCCNNYMTQNKDGFFKLIKFEFCSKCESLNSATTFSCEERENKGEDLLIPLSFHGENSLDAYAFVVLWSS